LERKIPIDLKNCTHKVIENTTRTLVNGATCGRLLRAATTRYRPKWDKRRHHRAAGTRRVRRHWKDETPVLGTV
jgi:hypothetical protein